MSDIEAFNSVDSLYNEITKYGYIPERELVLTLFLAYQLDRNVLLSGEPGVGKSEIAKIISLILNNDDPIRLQCFEGVDSSQAIYDWNYKKQLLYIESTKEKLNWEDIQDDIYSDKFLSVRPLLKAILSNKKEVLLIDEIDKSDEEFEAFLLETLAENQITIPEIGTIKANNKPFVILTSNDMRPLSDALKRRCFFHYIKYPSIEKEIQIVHSKVNIDDLLATQAIKFISLLRDEKLKKVPSISESIDWVRVLVKLNANTLDENLVKDTLNILLKTKEDIENIYGKVSTLIEKLPKKAIKVDKVKVENIKETTDNWDF